jgi:hypothetical protein
LDWAEAPSIKKNETRRGEVYAANFSMQYPILVLLIIMLYLKYHPGKIHTKILTGKCRFQEKHMTGKLLIWTSEEHRNGNFLPWNLLSQE